MEKDGERRGRFGELLGDEEPTARLQQTLAKLQAPRHRVRAREQEGKRAE